MMSHFVKFCSILLNSARWCQMVSDTCLIHQYRFCQVMSDSVKYFSNTCQILSDGVRYLFAISIHTLSGDVRFCQVPVRFCNIMSDGVKYMFEISIHILPSDVRFCQIPVRFCQMLSDTILHVTMDRPQGPLCRTLAKGPCAGPSPGAHVQDPCQVHW